MLYIYGGLFLALSIYKKNSKLVFYIGIIYLWLIATFVFGNADTALYELQYNKSIETTFTWAREPGWQWINKFFCYAKVPFWLFRGLIYGGGLYLISNTIKKLSLKKNMVLLLYLIFPFLIDVAQMRNFFAMSILIYAMPFLLKEEIGNILKYILCVILATSVHYIFIIYIGLLVINILTNKILIVIDILGMLIAPAILKYVPDIVLLVFKNFHGKQAYKYVMNGTISNRGTIICFIYFVFNILIFVVAEKLTNDKENENKIYIHRMLRVNLILSGSYFLTLYSLDFIRVIRNIMIVNYCIWCNCSRTFSDIKVKVFFNMCIIAFVILSCFLFIYYDFSDTVFWPAVQNNLFFNWFNLEY